MKDFDRGETFQLQFLIKRPQRLKHVCVKTEGQGGMESSHDVQFSDAQVQRFSGLLNNFLDTELKSIGIAFLARERAKRTA